MPTTEFWANFRAELFAGLIAGAVTGLAVGLALIVYSRYTDQQRFRRVLREACSILRGRLRSALRVRDVLDLGSPTASIPRAAVRIAEILENSPIDLWRREVPEEAAFFSAVLAFDAAERDFEQAASELETEVAHVIRSHNSARNAISENDASPMKLFVGRLNGLPDAQVIPWLDHGHHPWIEECWNALQASPVVQARGKRYLAGRQRLVEAIRQLDETIDRIDQ